MAKYHFIFGVFGNVLGIKYRFLAYFLPQKSFLGNHYVPAFFLHPLPGHFFLSSLPFHFPIFPFQIQKKRREERGRRRRHFFFIYLPNFFYEREKMNRMDAEEVLFISFFEEGNEEGQDQKNTKKTSFIRR